MSVTDNSFKKLSRGQTPAPRNTALHTASRKMTYLGAAAALAMLVPLGTANAAMIKLGNVDVQIDTTASFGATFLMSDRDKQFLPVANGGPADISAYGTASAATKALVDAKAAGDHGALDADGDFVNDADARDYNMLLGGTAIMTGCANSYGAFCQEIIAKPNFDGSINTDDGRLNFDNGDIVSAPVKLTSEIEAGSGAWNAFARVTAFYDAALMDDGSFEREGGGLSDKGQSRAGQNLRLLDAYVDYNGEVGTMPVLIRAGRQVINWGEATFIPGGNSAFSPIDVGAIRRPGAEIKEALLPVEALYGSIALNQDVTIEAYVGGWDDYRLDSGGTLFGGSDVFTPGVNGGNPHNVYYIGGGKRAGQQFACNTTALAAAGLDENGDNNGLETQLANAKRIADAILASGAINCGANNRNIEVLRDWTEGQAEQERFKSGDTNIVRGLANEDGDASAGLAVRWYAENLNSTEFAFYYQKVDSRLPYISFRTGKAGVTANSTGYRASTVGRGAGITGCLGLLTGNQGAVPALMGRLYNPAHAGITVNDAHGLLADDTEDNSEPSDAIQGVADSAVATAAATYTAARTGLIAAQQAILSGLPVNAESDTEMQASQRTAATAQLAALNATPAAYARASNLPKNSVAYLQETNCLNYLAQRDTRVSLGSAFDGSGQLPTGATNLQLDYDIGLFAEYPEVEIMGFSFNTTAFGWGVQGDFTFRPEMPLQFDTDSLTIASLFNNCAFATVGVLESVYHSGATYATEAATDASRQNIGCTDEGRYLQGYTTDHDAYTWDIGTTATFTRSNPVVSFLGADLGILLTEFQGVIAEDIEEMRGNTGGIGALGAAQGITPLSNTCQGGSDLPLNGILSIDDRTVGDASDPNDNNPKGFCRPTDSSWGAVLFAQLQYNNVFGTPFALRPTFVYNEGIEGYSPSPLGFWREGVGSMSVRLDASYLDAWQFGLAFTDYHGDKERTRNLDRNTLSLSASYAF